MDHDCVRYCDAAVNRFTQPDTIIHNPANPQDLNRYSYVNNNPSNNSDPTGHVCYSSGPNKGRCYDGEAWAVTPDEERATVRILSPDVELPDGSQQASENIRYSEFGDLTGFEIWQNYRYSHSRGLWAGDTDMLFLEQLALDRCGCRWEVSDIPGLGVVEWAAGSVIASIEDYRNCLQQATCLTGLVIVTMLSAPVAFGGWVWCTIR